jgi:hypothetical protein
MAQVTTAQVIMDDAEVILSDSSNERWAATELLAWVNSGMKEISMVKSDAYTVHAAVILVEGSLQSLPSTGFQLLDISHNMGTDGSTVGDAIRLTDRRILDVENLNWHSETGAAAVKYYMYDERVPTKFFVYPQQPSSSFGYVYMHYCAVPTEIAVGAYILVSDLYRNVLLDYVLYRAYLKDADYTENAQRAVAHYTAFNQALGVRRTLEIKQDPNVKRRPYKKSISEFGPPTGTV